MLDYNGLLYCFIQLFVSEITGFVLWIFIVSHTVMLCDGKHRMN